MVVMNERKYSVMELVKMLEEALPKGQVVVVGNGESLTDAHKAFLHSLTDCECECDGECECDCCDNCEECEYQYTEADLDREREDAYNEGYSDGESHKDAEIAEAYDEGFEDALRKVKEALCDLI